jgi:acetyl-CoA carboxylase biotin carboxyl carrier protein
MNNKEIHELIKLLDKSEVAEFKLKQGDFAITVRSKDFFKGKGQQVVSVMPNNSFPQAANTPPTSAPSNDQTGSDNAKSEAAAIEESSKYTEFKSPMVGTFYRKPSPDKELFVKVGDKINKGDVVAIIEAMKLFNEIESEVSGTIIKILVDDQTPVEYDQALFLIDPA